MKKLLFVIVLIVVGVGSTIVYSKSNKDVSKPPHFSPELMKLKMDTCPYPDKSNNVASVEDTEFGYQHCISCRIGVYSLRDDKRFICSYCGVESPTQSN